MIINLADVFDAGQQFFHSRGWHHGTLKAVNSIIGGEIRTIVEFYTLAQAEAPDIRIVSQSFPRCGKTRCDLASHVTL